MGLNKIAAVRGVGTYNSTLPTLTTGQTCDLQLDASGRLRTATTLIVGDIEIGAVELKNATTDDRALIGDADVARTTTSHVLVTQPVDAEGHVVDWSDLDDIRQSVQIMDDWDSSNRCNVNVAFGAGVAPQLDDTDKLGVSLYGKSSAAGDKEVLVDSAGHLQIDVLTAPEVTAERYTPDYLAAAAVDHVTKASAGFLKAIVVGEAVAGGIIEVSDHASDGDGNVKLLLTGSHLGPAVYPVDIDFSVGICSDITNQTHITFIYE